MAFVNIIDLMAIVNNGLEVSDRVAVKALLCWPAILYMSRQILFIWSQFPPNGVFYEYIHVQWVQTALSNVFQFYGEKLILLAAV